MEEPNIENKEENLNINEKEIKEEKDKKQELIIIKNAILNQKLIPSRLISKIF